MINSSQIIQKAERKYSAFLISIVTGESFFPINFSIGTLPKDYLDLRAGVTELIDQSKQSLGYGYVVELETRNTRNYGMQSLPKRVFFETERDYLKCLKKEKEVAQFKINVEHISTRMPQLQDWLCSNVLKVVEYSDRWPDLLKVCQYFDQNPRPNLYVRELSISVHTKFIEQHKKILRSLLEAILPVDQLGSLEGEKDYTFEKRFSLKYREPLIRLRLLDHSLQYKCGIPVTDLSIPISEFRQLNLSINRCFITENLMNFLTLPFHKESVAIFGSGYAVQNLKTVPWLCHCSIVYWGDLDADGFKILSQLRSYFPQTISMMMDLETFNQFTEFAVSVEGAIAASLPHLTEEELTTYTHLVTHQKRLEQERISQNYVNHVLQRFPG